MKFAKLYRESKDIFRRTISSMWLSEARNESQEAYINQINEKIDDLFAPTNAMPVVQSASPYKALSSASLEDANSLIEGLWKNSYPPYEHQYKSWKSLTETTHDKKVKSIVVTTGTGSGKTECFMYPLIADLKRRNQLSKNTGVEAIFLYPLNALMEDQKQRLQDLLADTNLTFAVYNSSLPERREENDEELCNLIDKEKESFPRILATREEMRRNPPNILLIHPSMLEYMLLRNEDSPLIKPESLKWIVIDETHTYSGAAATELAMLLRRVMQAFGTNSDKVRFATSSATIGNKEGNIDNNEDSKKLKQFIADISGQELSQIDIITGEQDIPKVKDLEIASCNNIFEENEYVELDQLITDQGLSIEERLEKLDSLCERGLKAKVHFFYRAFNQGLRVNLTKHRDGRFDIFTSTPSDAVEKDEPYLELVRCKSCGEYIALGESDDQGIYRAKTISDMDIFDFEEEEERTNMLVFSLKKEKYSDNEIKANTFVSIDKSNKMLEKPFEEGCWNLVRNLQCRCPHCDINILRKNNDEEGQEVESRRITLFRISSEFVSRIIAPVLLRNLSKAEASVNEFLPHNGQQYLSFVDSRQSVAKSTLNQNLEEERMWIYSRVFHRLLEQQKEYLEAKKNDEEIKDLEILEKKYRDEKKYEDALKIRDQLDELKQSPKDTKSKDFLTWIDIYNVLKDTPESKYLYQQFRQRNNRDNKEDIEIEEYIYGAMLEWLPNRPAKTRSPETMGLFTSYYALLDEEINDIPQAVEELNSHIEIEDNKISLDDWKNLLQLFLDHSIRSSISVEFSIPEKGLDVKKFRRFETGENTKRRTKKPDVSALSPGIVVHALCHLLGDNPKEVKTKFKNVLEKVIDALIETLIKVELIKEIQSSKGKDENESLQSSYVLNASNLGFKLYDKVYYCDTNRFQNKMSSFVPISNIFKGLSPYPKNGKLVKPIHQEVWGVYPYIYGKKDDKGKVSIEEIEKWAKENRKGLFSYNIWGENGRFTERLNEIYSFPDIFIQVEHTAQIDKNVAKESQKLFREKKINILACSTTMEMGIDLGDLELVLLCSVPPSPSNYKQRAGRSGRGINSKPSACITLCPSDAVGLRTLRNPLANLINRPTAIPKVDLSSQQIIQRHVNSYLLRNSGVFQRDGIKQEVLFFFTPYLFRKKPEGGIDKGSIIDEENRILSPDYGLGEKIKTRYFYFMNYILNYIAESKPNSQDGLKRIIQKTCFEGKINEVLKSSVDEIERCYEELDNYVSDIEKNYSSIEKNNDKYLNYLNHKYVEILRKDLLQYLAQHRFIPNANMPINIIEFDVNIAKSKLFSNNPSYTLNTAISQYAPGNMITLSNASYIVRGIMYTGTFRGSNTFKKVYTDGVKVTIDKKPKNHIVWDNISKRDFLELIQPYSFIPDVNETSTRKMKAKTFTKVDAQLINATEWRISEDNVHLISSRTSDDSGDSSILYYNVGRGYGYCVCSQCGKAVLENAPQNAIDKPINVPQEFLEGKDGIYSHNNIRKKGKKCYFSTENTPDNDIKNTIRRNVILGDCIQTDYCELKFYKSKFKKELDKKEDTGWIITLGIIFTRCLIEYLGVESNDINFIKMPNLNICIFDTNPGGSGYAKRLGDAEVLSQVVDRSLEMLNSLSSSEEFLDPFSMKYKEKLDIQGAIKWLEEEKECRKELPEKVKKHFPSAIQTTKTSLFEACRNKRNTKDDTILFVNDHWEGWNYKDEIIGDWNSIIYNLKSESCVIYILSKKEQTLIPPIKEMILKMTDWIKKIYFSEYELTNDLFPIAYVDDRLYFTTDLEKLNLNSNWASDEIYCVDKRVNNFGKVTEITSEKLSLEEKNTLRFILGEPYKQLETTDKIAKIVEENCSDLVKRFIDYTEKLESDEKVYVTYTDKHLKSGIGIVATIQFIKYYLEKIKREFEITYEVEDYGVDSYQSDTKLTKNLYPYTRNQRLKFLTNMFIEKFEYAGSLNDLSISDKKGLPHWRELNFKCGKKELQFFPDGGIINEWFLDEKRGKKRYTLDEISINDEIPIKQKQKIVYTVKITDCE